MMLKVAILDDDKISREIVKSYINFTDDVSLVVEFENPLVALQEIGKHACDVLFLDMEMPEMNGIDFIEAAKKIPQVIIISSKMEYAAASYNYDVTDYLVKPIEYGRFVKAIKRAKDIKESIALNEEDQDQHIFVKAGSELVKLNFSSIHYIEAFADYVQIYTSDKRFTVLSTMKSIMTKLGEDDFARVHRSYIVALNKIDSLTDAGAHIGDKLIKVSRKYKRELKEKLT
jgi:DNA-binding LytR/AlgR family response regulator